MSTILVAEDNSSVREAISTLLETEFHSVLTAENGKEAVDLFLRHRPDVVILDVMMPGKNGFDVCRAIRSADALTPVMFLSAKSDESDKVLGLGLGADDYLAKPFGTNEFLARVGALIRRAKAGAKIIAKRDLNTFRIGRGIVLGVELAFISAEGIRISITHREYMLLRLLYLRRGEIIQKEEILDLLWGANYLPNSRTLEQHLYNLRKKVDGNGFDICTIPRCGIRLEIEESMS